MNKEPSSGEMHWSGMEQKNPECPRRLYNDCLLLKEEIPAAWASRRTNKMRERFTQQNHQAKASMNLIAPVQPSLTDAPITGSAALL